MKITNDLKTDLQTTAKQTLIFGLIALGIICKLSSCTQKHCPSYGHDSKKLAQKQYIKCGTREAKVKKAYYASIQYR